MTMGCFVESELKITGVENMHEPKGKRQEASVITGSDWVVYRRLRSLE